MDPMNPTDGFLSPAFRRFLEDCNKSPRDFVLALESRLDQMNAEIGAMLDKLTEHRETLREVLASTIAARPEGLGMPVVYWEAFCASIDFAIRSADALETGHAEEAHVQQLRGAMENQETIFAILRQFAPVDPWKVGMTSGQHEAVTLALKYACMAGGAARATAGITEMRTYLQRTQRRGGGASAN